MGNSSENGEAPVLTDDLLIRFLLGELENAERTQVAKRSFLEDDVFDRLLEAENDLVDRYVKGELTAGERELFEKAALRRETMRQKLAFAQTLEAALAGPARVTSGPASAIQTGIRIGARRKRLLYGLAAAAALVVMIGGAVWIIRRSEVVRRNAGEGVAVNDQDREAVSPSPDVPADLSRDAQHPPRIAPTPDGSARPGATPGIRPNPKQTVGTFALLPGSTRSGEGLQALTIGSGVRSVRLQLQLDETKQYAVYDVIVRTVSGLVVSKRSDLSSRKLATGGAVIVELAAGALAPGEYEVELNGRRRAGPETLVNYYFFVVAKDR